jgi:hypothetical protein
LVRCVISYISLSVLPSSENIVPKYLNSFVYFALK